MNTRKNAMAQTILLACALTISACTGGVSPPEPPASPTSSVEKSTSPTPTATKPTYQPATAKGPAKNVPVPKMPKLAKEHSEEGAIAFVKHYFDVMNYSLETYTSKDLEKITMQNCRLCGVNFIDQVNLQAERKYWQVDGKYNIKVHGVKMNDKKEALLSFSLTINETKVYSQPKKLVTKVSEVSDPAQGVAILRWNDKWAMYDMNFSD